MDQLPLIVEDHDEALQATVMAIGGFKKVGAALWPDLAPDAAGRRLSDCCNPERRDVLAPKQLCLIRRMARQQGVHILAAYEMREAGYADPIPLEPEDERARLQREYVAAVKQLASLSNRLDRLA